MFNIFSKGPFLAALFACQLSLVAADRNVIFFIADDLGHQIGCYGHPQVKTPHMDALAADGTLFLNAYATTASCSASRSVIMTGLHNHTNGQYGHSHDFHKFSCFPSVAPFALPLVMERVGYRTAHIGKHHVAPEAIFNFGQMLKGPARNPVAMIEKCRDFLKEESKQPFFLYIGTSDPHRGGGTDETNPLRPDLFGNLPKRGSFEGVTEVFYQPEDVFVPPFLPDTPACRAELAQYYQSVARVDSGLGLLVAMLKELSLYDKTLIIVTSDHGMAFHGGKTTVYEGGLRVPLIVRDPYQKKRGIKSSALVSHTDITPSILDYAGGLDHDKNAPKNPLNVKEYIKENAGIGTDNMGKPITAFHGRSWLPILAEENPSSRAPLFASHTFHEIQMYYPMRVIRDQSFKLIWNMAHQLPYPSASDLWSSATWQAQWKLGMDAPYGSRTVDEYMNRPAFELYDMKYDPDETRNLADDPNHAKTLESMKKKLKALQRDLSDPWITKWEYE